MSDAPGPPPGPSGKQMLAMARAWLETRAKTMTVADAADTARRAMRDCREVWSRRHDILRDLRRKVT